MRSHRARAPYVEGTDRRAGSIGGLMVERRNPRRRTTNGVGFAASRYGGWLAVDEEERQWVRADASRVDAVQAARVERHPGTGRTRSLSSPASAARTPSWERSVRRRMTAARAVPPSGLRDLGGPSGASQPLPKVVQHVVVDVESVGLKAGRTSPVGRTSHGTRVLRVDRRLDDRPGLVRCVSRWLASDPRCRSADRWLPLGFHEVP